MRRIFLFALVALCVLTSATAAQPQTDLTSLQTYLVERVTALQGESVLLEEAAQQYFALAEAHGFDYAALWLSDAVAAWAALGAARDAWFIASPLYEQVEGIVAGVPAMSEYDVILDAGASGEDDPEGGVPFDLTLPDGHVLERPGNLFGVLESTLWGTRTDYSSGVEADFDDSGTADFGELLPDANVLVSAAEALRAYVDELLDVAQGWQPTLEDAFTALVVMTPTMSEYFASWRDSRFVAGDDSTQADFAVISRLSDVVDILGGLLVVYDGVSPLAQSVDAAQDAQISSGLLGLRSYVSDLYEQEQAGRAFSPEEADLFGSEAQSRAQALTGQIAQVAALAGVALPE